MADHDYHLTLRDDVARIARINAVPNILEVVCRTTGMRLAAVARVTDEHWVACQVQDEMSFGLRPGDELPLDTTICQDVRQSRQHVVIDEVATDAAWCDHHTPARYGFQSYISVPIILTDGSFFGTLFAINPKPTHVSKPEVVGMFKLFAELIAKHLDTEFRRERTERALDQERTTGTSA